MPTCPANLTVWEPANNNTLIKTVYLDKEYVSMLAGLRQAIDRERVRRSKPKWTWTPITPGLSFVKSVLIEEAFKALSDIYASPGSCSTYVAPVNGKTYEELCAIENIRPYVDTLKTAHLNLMRSRINILEENCIAHNTSYNTGYNTGYCTGNYSNYTSNYTSDLKTNNATQKHTYLTTNFADYGHNSTYNTSYNTTYNTSHRSSYWTTQSVNQSKCSSENR